MEDKQIIELFWKHSDDAIKEIERKYGPDCIYIAKHILSNDEAAELCLKISLQEEEFLYAMTEIEDCYLEEKINTGDKKETKNESAGIWGKYQIPILAGILFLVFIGFLWTKDSKGEENGEQLLQVFGGNIMLKEDFDLLAEKQPWKEENEIAALPIFQNLSYTGGLGVPILLFLYFYGRNWRICQILCTGCTRCYDF